MEFFIPSFCFRDSLNENSTPLAKKKKEKNFNIKINKENLMSSTSDIFKGKHKFTLFLNKKKP